MDDTQLILPKLIVYEALEGNDESERFAAVFRHGGLLWHFFAKSNEEVREKAENFYRTETKRLQSDSRYTRRPAAGDDVESKNADAPKTRGRPAVDQSHVKDMVFKAIPGMGEDAHAMIIFKKLVAEGLKGSPPLVYNALQQLEAEGKIVGSGKRPRIYKVI